MVRCLLVLDVGPNASLPPSVLAVKVLEHIRLPLISPYYLHDVIESLDVVREDQGCQRLISEAKDYQLLQDRRGELQCPRTRPRSSTGGPWVGGWVGR